MTKQHGPGFDDIFRWAEERDEYWIEGAKIEFAEEVVRQLAANRMARKELARRLGTSPAYITKVLRGSTNFTLESMVRLARALNCELRTHLQPAGASSAWLDVFASDVATAEAGAQAPECGYDQGEYAATTVEAVHETVALTA